MMCDTVTSEPNQPKLFLTPKMNDGDVFLENSHKMRLIN
jgi:hypothetical protein